MTINIHSDKDTTSYSRLKQLEAENKALKAENRALKNVQYEYQQKTKDLLSYNKDLERFAYVASHDLHEPLRMVSNFVQLLEQEYADKIDEEGKSYIQFAVDGVNRMQGLIDGLLEYNRIARPNISYSSFHLSDIITMQKHRLDSLIKASNTQLTSPTENIELFGEMRQISIVFHQLIKNAIVFNVAVSPEVEIKVKDQSNYWQFCIGDNGIGIPPRHQEIVFDLFKRLATPNHSQEMTLGLGLSLCKRIIERHGGKIWLQSSERGSQFYFTHPKSS